MKAPIGMNIKECVKCRWYSKNNNGSDSDLIKISISGASPASNPIKLAVINLSFVAIACAAVVPTMPCVNGSITI